MDAQSGSLPTNGLTERYHSLDALRSVAMLLGVMLHAAISFMQPVFPLWPAVDSHRAFGFAVFIVVVHAFRLQTFFLMAGFFAALLLDRRGYWGFIHHRCRRILLPLALFCIPLTPSLQALFVVGYAQQGPALNTGPYAADLDPSQYQTTPTEFFTSGRFLHEFSFFHLWFLWYLLWLYLAALIAAPWADRLVAATGADNWFRWLLRMRTKPLWLAVLTAALMLPMHGWSVDPPIRIWPKWELLLYYGFFFSFGWMLYRCRDRLDECKRLWKTYLLIALVALFPMLMLQGKGPMDPDRYDERFRWAALLVYALFTWLMVFGFTGLFLRCFSGPSAALRYVSDSSYWVYLVHLPLVIYLQMLVRDVDLPAFAKFLGILIVAGGLLWTSYHYCVRFTLVGVLLNGRRAHG